MAFRVSCAAVRKTLNAIRTVNVSYCRPTARMTQLDRINQD